MCDALGMGEFILGSGQRGMTATERLRWQQEMFRHQIQHPQQGMFMGGLPIQGPSYDDMLRGPWPAFSVPRVPSLMSITTSNLLRDYLSKKEKPTMQIFTEKIDKHLLIKVGCKKRIAHDKKELRAIMIEFLDKNIDVLWEGGTVVPLDAPQTSAKRMSGPGRDEGCVL